MKYTVVNFLNLFCQCLKKRTGNCSYSRWKEIEDRRLNIETRSYIAMMTKL